MKTITDLFRREPHRLVFLLRLLVYVVVTIVARESLDVETLLTLLVGVVGVDLVATEQARQQTVPAATLDDAQRLSTMGQVGAFAVEVVRSLLPSFVTGGTLAKGLAAIMPIIAPIANQALTPELQREVTAKVHSALKAAKLLREVEL